MIEQDSSAHRQPRPSVRSVPPDMGARARSRLSAARRATIVLSRRADVCKVHRHV